MSLTKRRDFYRHFFESEEKRANGKRGKTGEKEEETFLPAKEKRREKIGVERNARRSQKRKQTTTTTQETSSTPGTFTSLAFMITEEDPNAANVDSQAAETEHGSSVVGTTKTLLNRV